MTIPIKRAGLLIASAALIGAAACGNKNEPMDSALKADIESAAGGGIELAPTAAKSQMVVSAIEGGPKAAPAPAAKKPTPVKSRRPTVRAAVAQAPAPEPVKEQPVIEAPTPRPAPVQSAPREDNRVYKTEAEIFRQMPWIRP